jgi:hypothetical protein
MTCDHMPLPTSLPTSTAHKVLELSGFSLACLSPSSGEGLNETGGCQADASRATSAARRTRFGAAAGRRALAAQVCDWERTRKAASEGGTGAEGEDARRAWLRLGGTRNAATQPRPHDTHSRVPKETLRKLAPRGRSRGWGTREPAKNPRTQSSDGNDDGKDYLDCPPDLMARRGDCANPGRSGGGRGSGLGRRRPQIAACSQRPSPIGLGRPHPHSLPLRCSVPV